LNLILENIESDIRKYWIW